MFLAPVQATTRADPVISIGLGVLCAGVALRSNSVEIFSEIASLPVMIGGIVMAARSRTARRAAAAIIRARGVTRQFSPSPARPSVVLPALGGPVGRLPCLAGWSGDRAVPRAGVSGCVGHGHVRERRRWPGALGESFPQTGPEPARPGGQLLAGGQGLTGPEPTERTEQPGQARICVGHLAVDRLEEPLLATGESHVASPNTSHYDLIVSLLVRIVNPSPYFAARYARPPGHAEPVRMIARPRPVRAWTVELSAGPQVAAWSRAVPAVRVISSPRTPVVWR